MSSSQHLPLLQASLHCSWVVYRVSDMSCSTVMDSVSKDGRAVPFGLNAGGGRHGAPSCERAPLIVARRPGAAPATCRAPLRSPSTRLSCRLS
eukprot:1417855-Pleurochrysis_carterae.AAC.1